MTHRGVTVLAAVALSATALGCGSSANGPVSPTGFGAAGGTATSGANTASLKATAPTPQSPVNDQLLGDDATLTVAAATAKFANITLKYRFRVFDDSGAVVQDSGLVSDPSWVIPVALTPDQRFTWMARAEYHGAAGPWSSTASFTTPDPPRTGPPVGDWQHCAGLLNLKLVQCVHAAVHPTNTVGDLLVTERVAWLLRGLGAGLLLKSGGDNTIIWFGFSVSASRICFPDGHLFKVISDAGPGGGNGPDYTDNGFVDRSLYVAARDPDKR